MTLRTLHLIVSLFATALVLGGCATPTVTAPKMLSAAEMLKLDLAERKIPRAQKMRGRGKMEFLRWRNDDGIVPDDALAKAMQAREKLLLSSGERAKAAGVTPTSWVNIGPGNVAGRTRIVVPHPTDANTLWAGTARGGVWKTTDGAASWMPLTDALGANAVSTLVLDPRDANTLYAGTGEYSGRRGLGIFVSKDGGTSWAQMPATDPLKDTAWRFVNRIFVSPQVNGLMIVSTNDAVFRSLDGGATFSKVQTLTGYRMADGNGGNGAMDLKQDPHKSDRLITGHFDGSVSISEDNGTTWEKVPIIVPDAEPRRAEIAFSPAVANTVYASVDLNDGEVYKSTNAGRSWTLVATPKHLKKQGDYNNAIWVHPTQPNVILLGGVNLFRSLDGGASFKIFESATSGKGSNGFGQTAHNDHHAFVPAAQFPSGNRSVYNANDGGIWVNDDVAGSGLWRNLNNGLVATQVYATAIDAARGLLVSGTQDTGLVGYRFKKDGFDTWQEYSLGGDYFSPQLDPSSDYGYATVYYLLITRFRGDSEAEIDASNTNICNGIADAPTISGRCTGAADNQKANFDARILLDPNNPQRLYAGGNSLWVSTNPRAASPTWSAIKAPSTAASGDNYISAMAVRPGNGNEMWVGHNNGELYRTSNALSAGPLWRPVAGLPARLVEDIVFDRFDPKTIYVLLASTSSGNLQVSRDGGQTWAASGVGKLPDVSFASLAQHRTKRDWMYLGTFNGLYTSIDGGLTWRTSNDGPAAASVLSQSWLDDNTLVVSTFGRGVFKATVDTTPRKVTIYELYNASINHYFRTQDLGEANYLTTLPGDAKWVRTNDDFGAWAANQDDGSAQPVCRFYGDPKIGPNSHFYLVGRDNCIAFQAQESKTPNGQQRWNLESTEFSINIPTPAGCVGDAAKPVYRIYNNGFARSDSHHRYTTSQSEIARLTAAGWTSEGIVMCGM